MSYMSYGELEHMSPNEIFYAIATLGTSNAAIREAARSNLPGRENGPADAYRHLLLSAELTRRFGENYARQLLDAHEWSGNQDGQTPQQEAMDRHNNELGIELRCCIPCDHIPIRSRPLFWARDMMRGLIETLKAEQST